MLKIKTTLVSLFLLATAYAQPEKTTTLEQLDNNLQKIYNNSELPEFSIVLTSEDKTLFQHSYGFADIKTKKPFSNHSVQNIGSVSKTFIAMALMQAIDKGLLKLDDDINKYLPFKASNPHFPHDKITIRHLANHSSGIIDDAKYDKAYSLTNTKKLDKSKYSEDELEFLQSSLGNEITDESIFLESVLSSKGKLYTAESFTKFKPGSKYIYSNIGATLAAYVLEKASGVRYEDFVNANIFLPLNMSHTTFTLDTTH